MNLALQAMLDQITARAVRWPVMLVYSRTGDNHIGVDVRTRPGTRQVHLACLPCGQSVLCLNTNVDDPDTGYSVTPGDITTSVAAHVRQCHDETPAESA